MPSHRNPALRLALVALSGLLVRAATAGSATLAPSSPSFAERVDAVAATVLKDTGVPSASVAVVRDGRIVLLRAYGRARLAPAVPATEQMRFPIGSISKQFTAAAILLLAEDGRLSLDDPVARYLPELTRAGEVRIRNLLSHTSGYRDYWPQDYVPEPMLHAIPREQLLHDWAMLPLDFDPGTQYQYSNTGYVIAAAIVEKVSGRPFMQFLHERILDPLGMRSVLDVDTGRLAPADAGGYLRYGLGPLRPAPKEGAGWLFGMGELAMTAEDLARWDLAVLEQRILSRASWLAMTEATRLANGASAQYGLGLDVRMEDGRRVLEHGGEVSGFVAQNSIYPDDRAAVVVLTNEDASPAAQKLGERVRDLLFLDDTADGARQLERAKRIFALLQQGSRDRELLSPNAIAYFTPQALADCKASLAPLGAPKQFHQVTERLRGGMRLRRFELKFAHASLIVVARELADGRFEQFQMQPD